MATRVLLIVMLLVGRAFAEPIVSSGPVPEGLGDDGTNPKDGEHHFGIVHNPYFPGREMPYDPKPGYEAAKTLTTQLRGFRCRGRMKTDHPEDYVLIFTNGTDARLAAWTTARQPHPVTIPCPPGKFNIVSRAGESLPADRIHRRRLADHGNRFGAVHEARQR